MPAPSRWDPRGKGPLRRPPVAWQLSGSRRRDPAPACPCLQGGRRGVGRFRHTSPVSSDARPTHAGPRLGPCPGPPLSPPPFPTAPAAFAPGVPRSLFSCCALRLCSCRTRMLVGSVWITWSADGAVSWLARYTLGGGTSTWPLCSDCQRPLRVGGGQGRTSQAYSDIKIHAQVHAVFSKGARRTPSSAPAGQVQQQLANPSGHGDRDVFASLLAQSRHGTPTLK